MPMFAAAGTSVAMGNAPPEVKAAALSQLVIVPTNEEALIAEPKRMLLHEAAAIAAARDLAELGRETVRPGGPALTI